MEKSGIYQKIKSWIKFIILFFIFALWFEKGLLAPVNPATFRQYLTEQKSDKNKWTTFLGTSAGRVYLERGDTDSLIGKLGLGAERQVYWSRISNISDNLSENFTPTEIENLEKGINPWMKPAILP